MNHSHDAATNGTHNASEVSSDCGLRSKEVQPAIASVFLYRRDTLRLRIDLAKTVDSLLE